MKKALFPVFVLLILCILSIPAFALAAAEFPIEGYIANFQTATMYAKPSQTSRTIAVLSKGTPILVNSNTPYSDGKEYYVDVTYNGERGYIMIICIDVVLPDSMARPRSSTTITARDPNDDLLLRSGPGQNYGVIGYLFGGEQLDYYGDQEGNWYRVSYYGKFCWINRAYVKIRNWTKAELDAWQRSDPGPVQPTPPPEPTRPPKEEFGGAQSTTAPYEEWAPVITDKPEPEHEPAMPSMAAQDMTTWYLNALNQKDEKAMLALFYPATQDADCAEHVRAACEKFQDEIVLIDFVPIEVFSDQAKTPQYEELMRNAARDMDQAEDVCALVRVGQKTYHFTILCGVQGGQWHLLDTLSIAARMDGFDYSACGFVETRQQASGGLPAVSNLGENEMLLFVTNPTLQVGVAQFLEFTLLYGAGIREDILLVDENGTVLCQLINDGTGVLTDYVSIFQTQERVGTLQAVSGANASNTVSFMVWQAPADP
ncbi:MAG: SH3 domain-containing protein [Clostridia bacterium]|nr:SH3 domain-containing protein [Clostridia bacterium]